MNKNLSIAIGVGVVVIVFLFLFWNRYDFKTERGLVYRMNRFTGQVDWAHIGSNQWESLGNSALEDLAVQNQGLFRTVQGLDDSIKNLNRLVKAENQKASDLDDSLIFLNIYLEDLVEYNIITPKPETLGIHFSRRKGPVTVKDIEFMAFDTASIFYKKKKK